MFVFAITTKYTAIIGDLDNSRERYFIIMCRKLYVQSLEPLKHCGQNLDPLAVNQWSFLGLVKPKT